MHKHFMWIAMVWLISLTASSQTSYTLQEALDRAASNNAAIDEHNIELAKAENQIKEIRASGLPQVNGGISYNHYIAAPVNPVEDFITPSIFGVLEGTGLLPMGTYTGPPETFEFSFVPKNVLAGEINARWLVFDGSYLVAVEASKLYREFVASGLESKIQTVKANVIKSYLNVMLAQINKVTLENNIGTLEQSLTESRAIYAEGFIEQLDVKRLELSLSNLQSELLKVEELISLSKNLLKFYIRHPMEEDIVVSDDLNTLVDQLKTETDITLLELDVTTRPEWKEIGYGRDLQMMDVKRIKRQYYPNLSAFASFQESLQRNNLFDNDQTGWLPTAIVGLSANIPIYDGGMKKSQLATAQLELDKIDLDRQNFADQLNLQFMNAKSQFINAKYSLSAAEENLALNEEILQTTQIKYKEGVGSSLEVTQAESSLYQAQSAYMNAIYNLVNAKADLDIITGTL